MLEIICRPQAQSMQAVTWYVVIPLHSSTLVCVIATHCHSLSLIVTHCHVIVIVTHCHCHSLSLLLIVTHCYSLACHCYSLSCHCHVIVTSFALYNDMTMQHCNEVTMSQFSCQFFSALYSHRYCLLDDLLCHPVVRNVFKKPPIFMSIFFAYDE